MPDSPEPSPTEPRYKTVEEAAKIYLLPNLFTAGNMLCGFLSMQKCMGAKFVRSPEDVAGAYADYRMAVYLILGACVCDMFDGRVARASRRESLFGAEFDSIADTVSFGVAPAFLILFLLLNGDADATGFMSELMRDFGWVVAFIYLLCVGVRLARFNVITNPLVPGSEKRKSTGEFMGLPSPAAAGMIGSLVLLLTTANVPLAYLKPLMPPLVLLIAYIMVSNIPYPSFKHFSWNTGARARAFIGIIVLGILLAKYFTYTVPALFLAYIFYGIGRDIRRRFFMNREQLAKEEIPDEEF